MSGRTKYTQAFDGDVIRPKMRGYKTRCCDCGLTHVFNFRVVKDGRRHVVEFDVREDRRATAATRRAQRTPEAVKDAWGDVEELAIDAGVDGKRWIAAVTRFWKVARLARPSSTGGTET